MTSKCTAQLLADLGITRSLSRPQVSDDNPFSEAQFKTLKYHPGFPGRFDVSGCVKARISGEQGIRHPAICGAGDDSERWVSI